MISMIHWQTHYVKMNVHICIAITCTVDFFFWWTEVSEYFSGVNVFKNRDLWLLSKPWRLYKPGLVPLISHWERERWKLWKTVWGEETKRHKSKQLQQYKVISKHLTKGSQHPSCPPASFSIPPTHQISPWKQLLWGPWQWLFGLWESRFSLKRIRSSCDSCYLALTATRRTLTTH